MKENKRGHHKEGKIEEVNPNYIKNQDAWITL